MTPPFLLYHHIFPSKINHSLFLFIISWKFLNFSAINFFLRKEENVAVLKGLLLANMITHLFGLSADLWGIAGGVLTIAKMAPVEFTHLFVGIGSLIYYLQESK